MTLKPREDDDGPVKHDEARDPVHHIPFAEMVDGLLYKPGWYFWDETWADRHGPFEAEGEARRQLKVYCRIELMQGVEKGHRTRFWDRPDGITSTAVQFRTDADPMVHLHTNIGWVPIGNTPKDIAEAEKFAEECAVGYNLIERDQAHARYMAGWNDSEPDPEGEAA
jgi:hypothetical protein